MTNTMVEVTLSKRNQTYLFLYTVILDMGELKCVFVRLIVGKKNSTYSYLYYIPYEELKRVSTLLSLIQYCSSALCFVLIKNIIHKIHGTLYLLSSGQVKK